MTKVTAFPAPVSRLARHPANRLTHPGVKVPGGLLAPRRADGGGRDEFDESTPRVRSGSAALAVNFSINWACTAGQLNEFPVRRVGHKSIVPQPLSTMPISLTPGSLFLTRVTNVFTSSPSRRIR